MLNLDLKLKLLSGLPQEIKDAGTLYPITIGDIAKIGYTRYSQMMYVATLDAKAVLAQEYSEQFNDVSAFDIIYGIGGEEIRIVFEDLMKLVFHVDNVYYSSHFGALFLCGLGEINPKLEKNRFVNRDNYGEIKEYIEYTNCLRGNREDNSSNPINEKAKMIGEKMKKNREKIAKIKSNTRQEQQSDFADIISSVTAKSNSINKINIWSITVFQLYDEYKRINMIDNYEIGIQSILAGADKVKINHWSVGMEEN